MIKIFSLWFLIFSMNSLYAESLKIITGDFPPYSGERLPDGGLSASIVKSILKEKNIQYTLEYNPWNRAINLLKTASVAGSYPWAYSDARAEFMLFSNPLHNFRLVHYVVKGAKLTSKADLKNKVMCQPEGWEISMYDSMMKELNIKLIRPINMESCFRMLAKKRVDFISINEMVGRDYAKSVFPENSPVTPMPSPYLKKEYSYYFVVPKKYPGAQKLMDEFNDGLAKMKKKGL